MKKRMIDSDMPAGKLSRAEDFLPPPHQLAVSEKTRKVTIALNETSVDFFKREAQKNHTKYQRMIRAVLDRYASRFKASSS